MRTDGHHVIVGPFTLPLFGIPAPVANVERVRLLADLGLVLLLFALGMEFGWQRIRSLGLRIVLIGAIEISFMIAIGYQLGVFLGWSGTESLFLGAALSISSSAIIVKMLRDTGTLMTPHGKLIAGVLIVEDFAAVLLLSVLAGVATSRRRAARGPAVSGSDETSPGSGNSSDGWPSPNGCRAWVKSWPESRTS